jgi:hypothetical protein
MEQTCGYVHVCWLVGLTIDVISSSALAMEYPARHGQDSIEGALHELLRSGFLIVNDGG